MLIASIFYQIHKSSYYKTSGMINGSDPLDLIIERMKYNANLTRINSFKMVPYTDIAKIYTSYNHGKEVLIAN